MSSRSKAFLWTEQYPLVCATRSDSSSFHLGISFSTVLSGCRVALATHSFSSQLPGPLQGTISISPVETLRRTLVCTQPLPAPPQLIAEKRLYKGLTAPPTLSLVGAATALPREQDGIYIFPEDLSIVFRKHYVSIQTGQKRESGISAE